MILLTLFERFIIKTLKRTFTSLLHDYTPWQSLKYEKYTLHKSDDVEHRHPKRENLQNENQSHRVYHKFLRKKLVRNR